MKTRNKQMREDTERTLERMPPDNAENQARLRAHTARIRAELAAVSSRMDKDGRKAREV